MKKQSPYSTSDFLTASILSYHEHALEKLDKSNPDRIIFCFIKKEKTDKILGLFHKDKLKVEPKKFAYIQRDLKNRMFN